MCGIVGLADVSGSAAQSLTEVVEGMSACLAHRGPSDHGSWVDADAGIALGHRRLSILDLSSSGHQPMLSPNGRFVLSYNGEVYNHFALRRELESRGHRFHGTSDTETLVSAFAEWGIRATLERAVGMFALAVWDRERAQLTLARDRLGQKPLYYGMSGGAFLFGSELRALGAFPRFDNAIDRESVQSYLAYRYVPCPRSIFQGIQKLPPGSLLTYDRSSGATRLESYWSASAAALSGLRAPYRGGYAEGVEELERRLIEAVCSQTVSDVPLGTFLSGGIDSSLVVALLHKAGCGPLKTFTISVPDARYNEAEVAARVARHFSTDHEALAVSDGDLLDVVPRLSSIYDEPFADSSQIPTYLVSKLCRKEITVALSGDGGDELFGGYNRYTWGPKIWRWLPRFPVIARKLAAELLGRAPEGAINRWGVFSDHYLPRAMRFRLPVNKIRKLSQILPVRDREELYLRLVTDCSWPAGILAKGLVPEALDQPISLAEEMMIHDAQGYLPDDIHTKVDRASMAVSLEVRAPFMDHRLYEFAWTLPVQWKIRGSEGKSILRDVLARHLPREIFDRPKMGFAVPVGDWLRGPLREWAGDLLSPALLARQGLVDPRPVTRMWDEHLRCSRNWEFELWSLLMLSAWMTDRH